MKKILVFDIGGSSIKVGAFQDDKLIKKWFLEIPSTFDEMVELFISEFNKDKYIGIGISSPGAIDSKTGKGFGISAIDYIPSGGNLKTNLEAKLNVPITIENDANCATISEVLFNDNITNICYLVIGSGLGGGIIVDSQIISGNQFFGGEFGYIPNGDATFSHQIGFGTFINKYFEETGILTNGKEIFDNYEKKIEPFYSYVNDKYLALGQLLLILKFTVDPQKFIFSGAITSRTAFLNEVKYGLQLAMKNLDKGVDASKIEFDLEISKFGENANLYGAFGMCRKELDV